jgi:divalent metal cation (Fe/Co/Zn/Cd) transporter
MPDTPGANTATPKKEDWFDRLPRRTRALLLALLMFAASAVTFFLGLHGLRAGERITSMAGRSDWSDMFLCSAFTFILAAALVAVAFGWMKNAKPEDAETQPGK